MLAYGSPSGVAMGIGTPLADPTRGKFAIVALAVIPASSLHAGLLTRSATWVCICSRLAGIVACIYHWCFVKVVLIWPLHRDPVQVVAMRRRVGMAWSRTVGWAYSCSAASGRSWASGMLHKPPVQGWHRQGARPWVGGVVGSVPSRGQWGTMVKKLTPPNAVTRIQPLSNINPVLFYMPWQPSHWQFCGGLRPYTDYCKVMHPEGLGVGCCSGFRLDALSWGKFGRKHTLG